MLTRGVHFPVVRGEAKDSTHRERGLKARLVMLETGSGSEPPAPPPGQQTCLGSVGMSRSRAARPVAVHLLDLHVPGTIAAEHP